MDENVPGKERFAEAYRGAPPWDIGKPQPPFVEAAAEISGSVLDAGCGTGENALYFAARGCEMLGIDFLKTPIELARRKADQRGIAAQFLVLDALRLAELDRTFDVVIDCGLFHVFADDDRAKYVSQLAVATRPGGRVFLLCFSDKEPPGDGPRRITAEELRSAFAEGWQIESIDEARFEVRPDLKDVEFSPGGPFAWFCRLRRDEAGR